jgi:beta-glucanase (GH16 family)
MSIDGVSARHLLIPIICSLFITSCAKKSAMERSRWELVWEDNFDGSAGSVPDSSKWGYDIGTDWGNRQLEFDTDKAENAYLNGEGNLVIKAIQEDYKGYAYTSARIVTRDRFEPTYGKFEGRIKMPSGQGIWPAFWLLGSDIDSIGWPECGEIDIMEFRGQEPNIIHGTIHGPGFSGSKGIGKSILLNEGRFDEDFHTFSVEWEQDRIRWFMDDQLYHEIKPGDLPGDWVFDHPFYIILNLAIGGSYVGSPDKTSSFPQSLLVDFIRVYELVE